MLSVSALNKAIDKGCSAAVSLAVIGVNLFSVLCYNDTIVVPAMTAACCGTAAASKVLKRVINQSRPAGAPKLSPGMPSNHATSLSFLSIVGAAGVWLLTAPIPSPSPSADARVTQVWRSGRPAWVWAAVGAVLGFGLYGAALRVACGHHTVPQVLAGYVLGSVAALACLCANYYLYTGDRLGGYVDELPPTAKWAALSLCVGIGMVCFYSIMRGSPLLHKVGMLRLVCCRRQSGSIPGNLTSLLNRKNKTDNYEKFGKNSVPVGVPRLSRSETRPISILHETKHITVAGRNFCNNFSNNQFLVINKLNKEAIFVDACDDWPDDWAAFVSASRVTPTHVFLTHCHVDNVINLNALLVIIEKHLGKRLGIMWSPAELPWVREFPRACQRYGRVLEMRESLPMLHNSTYAYYTYKNELKRKQEVLNQQFRDAYGGELEGIGPDGERIIPPQVVRTDDVLLSSATNRSTSFHELGPHCTLHYVSTPGHSPGHTMLSLPRERLLFTGDLLFYNKVGRVDLPFASGELLAESLMALEGFPDNTVVLPGHGRLTTLGRERRENTALRTLYERRASGMQEVSVGFNEGYL